MKIIIEVDDKDLEKLTKPLMDLFKKKKVEIKKK